jgi:hypothetical protein
VRVCVCVLCMCVSVTHLEEKDTYSYLGQVFASGVENLKIKESCTLSELRC